MSETQYCPTCGCPVRVGGEGVTKYYVPALKEKTDKLCEAAKVALVGLDAHGHKKWADDLDEAIDAYEEAGNEQNRRRRHNA